MKKYLKKKNQLRENVLGLIKNMEEQQVNI